MYCDEVLEDTHLKVCREIYSSFLVTFFQIVLEWVVKFQVLWTTGGENTKLKT